MLFDKNLDIPLPYLLQKNFNFKQLDDSGWSLFHHAIACGNTSMVFEMIDLALDFNILSKNNGIYIGNIYNHSKKEKPLTHLFLNFTQSGYTPFHLNIFLLKYYKKKTNRIDIEYGRYLSQQEEIFKIIMSGENLNFLSFQDEEKQSVTDYILLTFQFDILKKIQSIDPDLDTLNAIKFETALKICQLELKKINYDKNSFSIEQVNLIEYFIDFFKAQTMKKTLDCLPCKDNEVKTKGKI